MKTALYLCLVFFTTICFSQPLSDCTLASNTDEYCIDDYPIGEHKSGTDLITAQVYSFATSESWFTNYIVISISYELSCDKETERYQHSKNSYNFARTSWFGGMSSEFTISNKTDAPSRIDGYKMEKAWAWLKENPRLGIVCNLKYQTQTAFSNSKITIAASAPGFPLSVTYEPGIQVQYAVAKSERILMKGNEYFDGTSGGGDCIAHCTPILIDLGHDGIHLGQADVGVEFDLLATGKPLTLQWVAPQGNEAFLALDRNYNRTIDDGSELFGNGTPLASNPTEKSPNGFVALAQYDNPELGGNNDGYITSADEVWHQLLLWLDSNADGQSSPNEIHTLSAYGIHQLETIPKQSDRQDQAGNLLPLWAWAESEQHKLKMVDVYFKVLN